MDETDTLDATKPGTLIRRRHYIAVSRTYTRVTGIPGRESSSTPSTSPRSPRSSTPSPPPTCPVGARRARWSARASSAGKWAPHHGLRHRQRALGTAACVPDRPETAGRVRPGVGITALPQANGHGPGTVVHGLLHAARRHRLDAQPLHQAGRTPSTVGLLSGTVTLVSMALKVSATGDQVDGTVATPSTTWSPSPAPCSLPFSGSAALHTWPPLLASGSLMLLEVGIDTPRYAHTARDPSHPHTAPGAP